MRRRDAFSELVKNRQPIVLSWIMAFFNVPTARRLLGEDCVPGDCVPGPEWNYGASCPDDTARKLRYAEASGNFSVGVGKNGSFAFGHGGPGEFCERLLETGENHRVTEYETGVKSRMQFSPHFYHNYGHPIAGPGDLAGLTLPDPNSPERYAGIREEARDLKDRDYIVHASLNGFFSGLHYFLYPYDKLLEGLLLEPDFIGELADRLGGFNLAAAERLLQCGVDMITFCDDLGSGQALMMSPVLYRRFFQPWHARLAELCHRHGAVLHLHSHGNINAILPDLCDAGVDILNPLDPTEGMNLPELKKRFGGSMTFCGGIDRFFFQWDEKRQREYLMSLAERAGGGFILMDSGGVPETLEKHRFDTILGMFKEVKRKWS